VLNGVNTEKDDQITREVNTVTELVTAENEAGIVRFTTVDKEEASWVHINYLEKGEEPVKKRGRR